MDENEEIVYSMSRTEAAMNMLSCIMQKITYQIMDSSSTKPEWYDNMTGVAIAIADAINQLENDGQPLGTVYTREEEPEFVCDFDINE